MGQRTRNRANNVNADGTPATIANIDTSKITTGTMADARISSSSVTQHSPATDLQPVRADISALALREATNESSAAFNLPNSFIDTFTDDTNLGTQTDVDRVSGAIITQTDTTPPSVKILIQGNDSACKETINNVTPTLTTATQSTGHKKFGTGSVHFPSAGAKARYGTIAAGNIATDQDFSIDCWVYHSDSHSSESPVFDIGGYYTAGINGALMCRVDEHAQSKLSIQMTDGTSNQYGATGSSGDIPDAQWFHLAVTRTSNVWKVFVDGTDAGLSFSGSNAGNEITMGSGYGLDLGWIQQQNQSMDGYIDNFRVSVGTNLFGTSNFTPYSSEIEYITTSATGTLIQSANVLGSAKTKVGGTMLYKDNAGTATIGTDLKIYFTCNGNAGSPDWTEATSYNVITPVYGTGIKQIRLGETTCTSGTDVRYKAVWANQAEGSKETQLHGIGINY